MFPIVDESFRRLVAIMFRDLGQLLPAGANSLQTNIRKGQRFA